MADTDIRKSFHQQLDEIQHDIVRHGGDGHRGGPPGHRGAARRRPARRRRSSSRATTCSTRWPSSSRSAATSSSPCSSRWPATCAASSPRMRMVSEIERSGDLVVNIAKGARRIYGTDVRRRGSGAHHPDGRRVGAALPRRHRRLRRAATTAWPPRSTTSTTGSTPCTRTTSRRSSRPTAAERARDPGRRCSWR